MKKIKLFSIALFLLAASTASAQDVRYNFDKDTEFSKFKTYKWVTIKDASKLDDLRDKQIKEAVEAELAGLPTPTSTPAISMLAIRRESAQRDNSRPTSPAGGVVRVGTGAVGTVRGVA